MDRSPKPAWLKVAVRAGVAPLVAHVDGVLARYRLHTVCRSAHCPNLPTCWGQGTATFMILGDVCTRACRFCAVDHGRPQPPDPTEPQHLAQAVRDLGLQYVVLTSVDRDDLPDGGAAHYAACVQQVRAAAPHALVEVLIPDFQGDPRALEAVLQAGPHVVGHNVETVPRLTRWVRDRRCSYELSLRVLKAVKERAAEVVTKSSLLLGLGETADEVRGVLWDLRHVGVDIVVLGQYLRPTPKQLPVARYVPPEEFAAWAEEARALGFAAVVAAPLARTSYRAEAAYRQVRG